MTTRPLAAAGPPLALALAALAAAAAGPAPAAPRARVLIVADEQEPMKALAAFFRDPAGCDVRLIDQKDLPADLDAFTGVFMYIHGRMTPETSRALIGYARAGGRLVILHHGIASGRMRNPDWMAFTGMYIAPRSERRYPWKVVGNTTHTLVNLRPGHYITTHNVTYDRLVPYLSSDMPSRPVRLPALDLKNTEVFLNQHFTDGRAKTVLFGFRCTPPGASEPVMQDRSGWYKPAGAGWVFYLQPGHATGDFRNRDYCQILWNCLTWRPEMKPAGRPVRIRRKNGQHPDPPGRRTPPPAGHVRLGISAGAWRETK